MVLNGFCLPAPMDLDKESNVYRFNGKHLGWFEDGIFLDYLEKLGGFTPSTCPVFPKSEPLKAFKQPKSFKVL